MKIKYLYLVLALSTVAFSANAQWEEGTQKVNFSLGVGAGASYSLMNSSSSTLIPDFKGGFGYSGGVAFNFRFLRRSEWESASTGIIAVQPEVKYASTSIGIDNTTLNLSYLTVPLMLQVYPLKNFYIEVGPKFALNLSHSPDNIALSGSEIDFSNLKANDIMAGVGLGYRSKGFMLGARYNIGFSNLASNLQWRQSSFQINVNYLFELKNGNNGF